MRIVKLMMLGMVSMFAVGLMSSSSALALENCELQTGTKFVICVEQGGKTLLVPTAVTFLSKKEPGTSSKLVVPELDTIECQNAENSGTFPAPGTTGTSITNLVIKFTSCIQSTEPGKCTVEEPITTKSINGGISLTAGGEIDIVFTPTTGTEFATVTVLNKGTEVCSGKATLKVSGSQLCESNGEELFAITQLLVCLPTGSHLKSAGKANEFELTEEVWLDSGFEGNPWAIVEGN
jgi:hypothetical protein